MPPPEEEQGVREAALNEVANRGANEQIAPAPEAGWDLGLVERHCECGHAGCSAQLKLTVAEYEGLRQDARRFAIVPEHVVPAVEHVVERHPRYTVVEKDDEAAAIAQAENPRA